MNLKRFFSVFMTIALILSFSIHSSIQIDAETSKSTTETSEESKIIVKFKDKTSKEIKKQIHLEEKAEVLKKNEQLGFEVVKIKGKSVEKALKQYKDRADVEYAEPIVTYHALFTPNDALYSTDQYGPQMIDIEKAWEITQGSESVVVAVLDTGVQADHEDLQGKVIPGYDFIDNDSDPSDEQGHGTHVAGTVGAATNNEIGVAGVAPNVKIMSIRVLNEFGSGTNAGIADGITFAADHGADVINLSLGGPSSSITLENAVNYAWNQGAVVIVSAGNAGTSIPQYPAYYENSLSVGATNSNDIKWSASTYGTWVDVAAPGANIISTQLGGGYIYDSGTSMAAPHVAGLAGLLASQGLTNVEIRNVIESTAEPISGTGTYWEHGRVNAFLALSGGDVPDPDPTIVFEDDFETDLGWVVNPNNNDSATTGIWERAIPELTDYNGTKQQGTTSSGSFDLVTGGNAGSSAGVNDIDSGVTTIQSPVISLPSDGSLTLSFTYYFSHYTNANRDDFFRLNLVRSDETVVTLFEELGASSDQDAAWSNQALDLSAYSGEDVYLQFKASDAGSPSLVEAGVDDVKIEKNEPPNSIEQMIH
ncbi:S8 family serine peptidase [Chengkuizengella axinellae]|uniref:S8 family serine peptidase n=1 Tax=Chengkuizengella axinellae TaxID=3064388 RepID=A0ABT9IXY4_9BACL|nr:S8 family serine peptidase [Chengkuizengella sp. 2205SS18-9]MDP5274223.1 S8 family serine peptidase [Chengkuizengella sp. 2205SS18-9]